MVDRKTEITPIDGTPEKRMFWSIISDYDLRTGLLELIDNALDLWMQRKVRKPLKVDVCLDYDRQIISVIDNAGGVKPEELRLLVVPGGSRNDPAAEVIGIFGVGSKRAGVALGEHVEIKTRYGRGQSLEVDITDEWLKSPEWELAAYEIPSVKQGTTQVKISELRKPFSEQDVEDMCDHLGETYDWFLGQDCSIEVNGRVITGKSFEAWAFPKEFAPKSANFNLDLAAEGALSVNITAGLTRDRIPETENYGVYFYCNHRLIVKELKIREVGYHVKSEAGVPHPDASLCRVIVRMQGPARLMPWNSAKNGINFDHAAFQMARPTLIPLVSHFSSLSRRLKNDWPKKVFRYDAGNIQEIDHVEDGSSQKLVLPPLPSVRKPQVEHLKSRNKKRIRDMPWTLGIVEAMGAVQVITRQRLDTKNRLALIVLDSTFEIALKELIVHRDDLFPRKQHSNAAIQKLFERRHEVIKTISQKVAIPKVLLDKAKHYYDLRNKLIHERATVDITDTDVDNYRSTVEQILTILFQLKF